MRTAQWMSHAISPASSRLLPSLPKVFPHLPFQPFHCFSSASTPAPLNRSFNPPPHPSDPSRPPSPPRSLSSPSGPPSTGSPAVPLPARALFRLRPTHRRFSPGIRHDPLTPLRARPVTHPPHPRASSRNGAPTPSPIVPFRLIRTPSLQLPVYVKLKGGGTVAWTWVRKIEGDMEALAMEMRKALGANAEVRVRAGRVEVKGNWKAALDRWFTTLGF